MIKLLKNGIQRMHEAFGLYRRSGVNAEDEELAMSCGAFNPRFLAKIKKTKADSLMEHADTGKDASAKLPLN